MRYLTILLLCMVCITADGCATRKTASTIEGLEDVIHVQPGATVTGVQLPTADGKTVDLKVSKPSLLVSLDALVRYEKSKGV